MTSLSERGSSTRPGAVPRSVPARRTSVFGGVPSIVTSTCVGCAGAGAGSGALGAGRGAGSPAATAPDAAAAAAAGSAGAAGGSGSRPLLRTMITTTTTAAASSAPPPSSTCGASPRRASGGRLSSGGLSGRLSASLAPGGRLLAIVGEPPVMEARLVTFAGAGAWCTIGLFETCIAPLKNAVQPERFTF